MIKNLFKIFVPIFFLFASCTSSKHLVYMKNIENNKTVKEYKIQQLDYRLCKGDIVYLKILSTNKDLSDLFNPSDFGLTATTQSTSSALMSYLKGFMINDSGNIIIPIIKSIKIEGLTISEAERTIQQKVEKYLNNTTLIVKLLSFNVNVLGEVNMPGTKEVYQSNINILEVIARAGDIKETGDKKNVLILRRLGDKVETFTVDLTDDALITSDNYLLQPNDVIIVQPVKLKAFRINAPSISLILSAISTLLLVYNVIK